MDLDSLKSAWDAHAAMLERSLAINERVLREILLRKTRAALVPYGLGRAAEVVAGVLVLLLTVRVVLAHLGEPRYHVVAGAFLGFAAGMTAVSAYRLVRTMRLDAGRPVVELQRSLARLRVVEFHAFKWALLGGIVFWLPALLVLVEAVTGVAALARVDLTFLVANMALGGVLFAAGFAWARRYVDRPVPGPRTRRLVDALAGRSLQRAARHLEELARFQRDDAPG